MARVKLIEKEGAVPEIRELFKKVESSGNRVLNIQKAVCNSPKVGRDFLRLGTAILFKGALSPLLRELAILRIGHLNKANYEWVQHVPIGIAAGLTQEQVNSIPSWQNSTLFDNHQRAILQFADEVSQNVKASDDTFIAVQNFLNEQEIVELTITIGYYGMVSRILETLQIELEE